MEFEEKLLGALIVANGSNVSQRAKLIGSLWGALSRNRKIFSASVISNASKCYFWSLLMSGAVGYLVPVLRPNKQNLTGIQTTNNKIMTSFLRVQRNDGESQPHFFKRRSILLRSLQQEHRCCSTDVWLHRLVRWCTHIGRHPEFPVSRLLHIQGDAWLEERRASHNERPACRENAGFVSRWSEGWWAVVGEMEGFGWLVRKGDKTEERRRVDFLRTLIFGAEIAIEDGAVIFGEIGDRDPIQ